MCSEVVLGNLLTLQCHEKPHWWSLVSQQKMRCLPPSLDIPQDLLAKQKNHCWSVKQRQSITVYFAPRDYSLVLPSTTCFSRQNRPAWTVWRRFSCTRSRRVLDPSLPPWSPLTQMERPNCSGCLTIKAPMVELNYTNSKQFFIWAGHKTTRPACLSALLGGPLIHY